jgi:serine/threonine-protein kinase
MTPDRHARVKDIFIAACSKPADQREAFVQHACGDDDELRAEVNELLRHASVGQINADDDQEDEPEDPRSRETRLVGDGQPDAERIPTRLREATRFEPGEIVAERYRIIQLLGRGGMGEVYHADDLILNQPVAVKFLRARTARDPAWLARFYHEVRVARQVTHRNVCRVYDIGATEAEHFISMEYVDGEDLASLLKRIGRLPHDKCLDIARQLCAGLAAAHAKGVLHRDLKPANVMLDGKGQVRITDFGLAGTREEIERADVQAGTPAYMAPEQLAGQDVSIRSDIYAMGLVLYELFTGRQAFKAGSVPELMRRQASEQPALPSTLIPDMDLAVERVILQCLEKDPRKRPASVLAIAAALPGGDALSVALAAGETPSPDLVAAAGQHTGAPAWLTGIGLAAFVVLLGIFLVVPHEARTVVWDNLEKAPSVLANQAQELAGALRPTLERTDEAYGLSHDLTCQLATAPPDDEARPLYATLAGTEALFWYRQSARRLHPIRADTLLYGGANVTPIDPPTTDPGQVTIVLDPTGSLLGFEATPEYNGDTAQTPATPDWSSLIAAAALDATQLKPVQPTLRPHAYADTRVAWSGWRGDPPTPVRVEAAAHEGLPVLFAVLKRAAEPSDQPPWYATGARRRFVSQIYAALVAVVVLVSVPLAQLSLYQGRADLRGARRLAVFVFGARLLIWLLLARHHHAWEQELTLLSFALVGAIGEAILVWLFYIALEPYVRKFWPQTMIAWSRLLVGRFRDPLVGRHLLLGAAFGLYLALIPQVDWHLAHWLNFPIREGWREHDPLAGVMGARAAIAVVADAVRDAVYSGLLILLIVSLLRALLRRPLIAATVAVAIIGALYVPRGTHPAISWPIMGIGGIGMAVWVMTRFGLLAIVTAVFVSALMLRFPVSLDLQPWYADVSLLALALALGVAIYGFMTARRREPGYVLPEPARSSGAMR